MSKVFNSTASQHSWASHPLKESENAKPQGIPKWAKFSWSWKIWTSTGSRALASCEACSRVQEVQPDEFSGHRLIEAEKTWYMGGVNWEENHHPKIMILMISGTRHHQEKPNHPILSFYRWCFLILSLQVHLQDREVANGNNDKIKDVPASTERTNVVLCHGKKEKGTESDVCTYVSWYCKETCIPKVSSMY